MDEEIPIYKDVEVPAALEKTIPMARRMVKEEMKKEVMEHQIREREKRAMTPAAADPEWQILSHKK